MMKSLNFTVEEMANFGDGCLAVGQVMGWDKQQTIVMLSLLSAFLRDEHGVKVHDVETRKLDS